MRRVHKNKRYSDRIIKVKSPLSFYGTGNLIFYCIIKLILSRIVLDYLEFILIAFFLMIFLKYVAPTMSAKKSIHFFTCFS